MQAFPIWYSYMKLHVNISHDKDIIILSLNQSGATCNLNLTNSDDQLYSKNTTLMCFLEYDMFCNVLSSNCTHLLQHNRKYSGTVQCEGALSSWANKLSLSK